MRQFAILVGDVRDRLKDIPGGTVQCVVTSPPYFGLRDYGVEGQIGLETRPDCLGWATGVVCGECFVCTMVAVFREVRRVLRDDGTVWLNLGDSYANDAKWGGSSGGKHAYGLHGQTGIGRGRVKTGLKPKDLIGIPWRVAFALQADGWYLRSDIVWNKPNPMPESVVDRPTKSHEYVFLLAKSDRYFFDKDAVMESGAGHSWSSAKGFSEEGQAKRGASVGHTNGVGFHSQDIKTGRNIRSVWTITTKPFAGAHFATFPEDLPSRCILAGTSAGGQCPTCGTPYRRIVEDLAPNLEQQQRACGGDANGEYSGQAIKEYDGTGTQNASYVKRRILAGMVETRTIGWRPTCGCAVAVKGEPQIVLDPFNGAGTTGVVALGLDRRYVGIELNPQYADMARARILERAGPLITSEVHDCARLSEPLP